MAIFTVDDAGDAGRPEPRAAAARGGAVHGALDRLGGWLDAPYAGVVIAAALVVILVLGLLLLRR